MVGFAVLAEPLFTVFLKDNLLPAVPYLQLFCAVGMIYPLNDINLNVLKVKGRSDLFLYLEIVKKILVVIVLFISVPYGIFGILIGRIFTSILCYIPNSYFSIKLIGYSVVEQLRDFGTTLLLAFAMGIFMYVVGLFLPFDGLVFLLAVGLLGTAFYIVINHLLKMQAQILLLEIIKNKNLKGTE